MKNSFYPHAFLKMSKIFQKIERIIPNFLVLLFDANFMKIQPKVAIDLDLNFIVGAGIPVIMKRRRTVCPERLNLRSDKNCLVIGPTGPKIKFYLFPLTRPTLKKGHYPKDFISIFSLEFFFLKFIGNLLT